MNRETRVCQNCRASFQIDVVDFEFYEKIKVPSPTWCPECRMMRRMIWTGYRVLYKRKCDFSGEDVITFYHPKVDRKIYRQDIWWSDKVDNKSLGREYDFSKSFFDQLLDLYKTAPLPSLHTEYSSMVNSPYCNGAAQLKNCYLCFRADRSEDCAYLHFISFLKDCLDATYAFSSELSYEVLDVNKCFKVFYSQGCEDSHDIYFSRDLSGCSYCIGCINLRNRNHYIFNQPVSKEEYEKKLVEFNLGSRSRVKELRKKADDFILSQPHRSFRGRKNTDGSGNYIFDSKQVHDSFMVHGGEDARYSQFLKTPAAQIYDTTLSGINAEWVYESTWVPLNVNNIKFSFWNYNSHHLEYCISCHGSENLFGCVGLKKAEYCIFNKQYSKEDFYPQVERIKKQMADSYGNFLPKELCPWAYNETHAYEFFPLSKEDVLKRGFTWRDPDQKEYQAATVGLSDHIKDAPDSILDGILKCLDCGKNYRLIKMELDFYRKLNIPIPDKCSLCRDRARIKKLNPLQIYDRVCGRCGNDIKTTYAPDRPEIVYCESCYHNEVI